MRLLLVVLLLVGPARSEEVYLPGQSLWVNPVSRGLLVTCVNPNGPASTTFQRGDLLLSVDGQSLAGLSESKVKSMLSIPEGSVLAERRSKIVELKLVASAPLPFLAVVTEIEPSRNFTVVWAYLLNLTDSEAEIELSSVTLTDRSGGSFPSSLRQKSGGTEVVPPGGSYVLWPAFETRGKALGSFRFKDGLGNRYQVPPQARATNFGPWSSLPRSVQELVIRQLRRESDFHWWGRR